MDATEKETLRAELLASGVIRYWGFIKAKDQLDRWLEVMGETLAELQDPEAGLKIRANLLTYGLRVPDVPRSVHVDAPVVSQTLETVHGSGAGNLCSGLTSADSQGPAVHLSAASNSQPQQNLETSERSEACRAFTNIYSKEEDPTPVHPLHIRDSQVEQSAKGEASGSLSTGLTLAIPGQPPANRPTGSWTWRNWSYNRVPPAIEQAVRERFSEGWTKSHLAREFRLNRRTIIRICRSCA